MSMLFQTSQTNTDPRVHAVPGTAAIAFTSIISGSLPPSGIYNQQPSTTTTGGASRAGSMFNFSFGSSGSHGNTQQPASTGVTTSSNSTQNTSQGTEGRDNVRIVMDDFVALFSNSQPVTSHSETSRNCHNYPITNSIVKEIQTLRHRIQGLQQHQELFHESISEVFH